MKIIPSIFGGTYFCNPSNMSWSFCQQFGLDRLVPIQSGFRFCFHQFFNAVFAYLFVQFCPINGSQFAKNEHSNQSNSIGIWLQKMSKFIKEEFCFFPFVFPNHRQLTFISAASFPSSIIAFSTGNRWIRAFPP